MTSWTASWSPRHGWHARGTPCCWPRDARPWTSSATTQLAETPSSRRSDASTAEPEGTGMSTTADRRAPAVVDAAHRVLERPLASYPLVLGPSALLLGLRPTMVLTASSLLASHVYRR